MKSIPPIRKATRADLPLLLALERAIFPDPWPPSMFEGEIEWGGVLVAGGVETAEIVGFVVAVFERNRVHIANLAVARDHRRQGLGRRLLDEAIDAGGCKGARAAWLEVRASNAAARELYTAAGFREIGRRTGYYRRSRLLGREDAVIYRRDFGSPED
ncbi:MAG: ribosomal-protein-alanine N-acetyltransferase [Gemmatimonadetes bacterium]|nr:ribosomal-protein-alanine N-acetyltransferase [Gemmatimonadota bacterium]